jgi:hypothetical protein
LPMDYTLNIILVVIGAFTILTIALLLWIANLLIELAALSRDLRKAKYWNELYQSDLRRRRERL